MSMPSRSRGLQLNTGCHVQALCISIFLISSLATLVSAVGSDRLRHRYSLAMLGKGKVSTLPYSCQSG
ncbi:hypothetical protein BDV97DRAFT_364300 [Delphinella strobiligena]|nr:hypothetical protein BDV97DRAFT_364300 [Delphinella strobiligena]